MKFSSDSGQMLLIVVMTMAVVLTVGLSAVSRTITNVKIAQQNDESQRAFSAAEAGIEESIKSNSSISSPTSFSNNASFQTSVDSNALSGSSFLITGGETIIQDVGASVWLSDYKPTIFNNQITTQLKFYWGTSNQNNCANIGSNVPPALEIIELSGNKNDPTLNKYVFDPCGRINGATSPSSGAYPISFLGVTTTFNYATSTIPITNGLILKVIPIYDSTVVGVDVPCGPPSSGCDSLPQQGSIITATGNSGDTVKKIQTVQSWPEIPTEMFQYSILSQ